MTFLILDQGYEFILYIALGIMFGPPLILGLIGRSYRRSNPKTAKIFYIIAVVYLVIGLGICGSMMI